MINTCMSYNKSISFFTFFRLLRIHSVSMHLVPYNISQNDEEMSAERHLHGSKLSCLTGKHMHKRNQDDLIRLLLLTYCILGIVEHVLLLLTITKNNFITLILQDNRSCKLH